MLCPPGVVNINWYIIRVLATDVVIKNAVDDRCGDLIASYSGLMFFNIHEKNQEGLVDFGDIMDMVCDDMHCNE